MINLLPRNEKKEIYKEYSLRRLSLALFISCVLFVSIGVLLLPSYIISLYRANGVPAGAASAVNKSKTTEADVKARMDNAKTLIQFMKPEPYTLPSQLVSYLMRNKTSENTITSIAFTRVSTSTVSVAVRGVAKTRKSLMAFTSALEREPGIEKVDVPVSNFVKDSHITFSFTLFTRPQR